MTAGTTPPERLGRPFTVLWAGQTASLLGTNVSAAGVSIAAFVETGSVWWLSILYLAVRMPGLLASSHAGDLVDRSDRRTVLLGADAVAAAATGAALVLLLLGHLELWHLVVVAVVGSTATAYQEPAYQSALPLLVPRAAVDRANGMLQLGPALGLLAGPAIAGLLVGLGGIGAVLVFDAVTFLLAVAATNAVRIPGPVVRAGADGADRTDDTALDVRGLRATWHSLTGRLHGLRHLLLYAGALNLVLSVVNVLLFALLVPLVGEEGSGLLLSLGGVAMLATAATISARGVPARRVRALSLATITAGLGLVVCGLRPSPVMIAAGLMATLGSAAMLTAAAGTLFQTEVAAERQGRLAALRRVASEAFVPFAVIGVAPLAERLAQPAMAPDGALADTIGRVLGTGPGRGVALLFVGVGVVVVALGVALGRDRSLAVLNRPADDESPAVQRPEPVASSAHGVRPSPQGDAAGPAGA